MDVRKRLERKSNNSNYFLFVVRIIHLMQLRAFVTSALDAIQKAIQR